MPINIERNPWAEQVHDDFFRELVEVITRSGEVNSGPVMVMHGNEEQIRVTYTNGRVWNQKNVTDWSIIDSKSGGFDIDYNFAIVEESDNANFNETAEGIVHHVSKGGDVASVETFYEVNGVSASTLYKFQPVKAR